MKYLLIVDLMGTLLEANQVFECVQSLNSAKRFYKNEYESRILCISRKLNEFLERGNRVYIVTSEDHCSEERLLEIIRDIDKNIYFHNRNKIKYFITGYINVSLEHEFGERLVITFKREHAYDLSIKENVGYYFITIDDDLINSGCVSKVLDLGGQYIHIDNMLNSTGWYDFERYEYIKKHFHINDNIDRLVSYYEQCSSIFSESCNFSKDEIYLKLLENKLDVDELYSWLIIRDIKNEFQREVGYSFDYTQKLIDHKCIQVYPSFEQAYRKALIPKMK